MMLAIGQAAKAAKRPVALLIDELQYLSESEFSALILSIHKLNQNSLPVILVGAGLPQILGLAGASKSYAERLFKFTEIGALDESDAVNAIVNPAREEGVSIERAAVAQILTLTERYPYNSGRMKHGTSPTARSWSSWPRASIHAPFLYTLKASGPEFGAGLKYAVDNGWLELHERVLS
ncbi:MULTISPECIES: ATP-binding protein [unclassified Bradyrhizobium]|uniref:ATP-binding protein n=1 Tax=unclassified Bradyrhizobium TaxID=2631580 RepID=UPI002478F8DF|nr:MULTISPECIES: ATP-binding protein [unclassified Bradyrhizobium]WGR70479.1 ATP-binding protein [Bradyrhizobium sp. ISRA426]WGR82535.1 ATP-binding protein [Bradyrhizobium sp. ISRA430]WGR85722.1 ATP-binding protein [Bradyrhizobium sp. ISRA432]